MADPFSSYGAEESPVRLVEQDEQQAALSGLKAHQLMNDIAMQPDKTALLRAQAGTQQAHARLYGSMASEHENNVLRENKFADAILALPGGLPQDPAEAQDALARLAAGSGALKLSREHAAAGALIRQREAKAAHETASAAKVELDADRLKMSSLESLVRDVESSNNPADAWHRGNLYYSLLHNGEASPMQGVPYSPEALQQLRESVVSRKDKLAAAQKKVEEQGRNYRAGLVSNDRALARDIERERVRISQDRETRLAKVGGKATGSPSRGETEAVFGLLDDDPVAKTLSAADKNRLAYDVASRAKELRTANRALGSSEALRMALREAHDAGDIEPTGGYDLPLIGKVGGSTRYRGGGKSAATAVPLPAGGKSADLQKGRYYSHAGEARQWLGDGWGDPVDEDEED